MRLEIEDMSYEEFIAQGERICSVSTSLSEETITTQLKTKVYTRNSNNINHESFPYEIQEIDACIICQIEFKDQKNIGIPRCKHEYYVHYITKWLVIKKNECPICKSEALTSTKNNTQKYINIL